MNDILSNQTNHLNDETITDEVSSKLDSSCNICLRYCRLECESIKSISGIMAVGSWVKKQGKQTLLNADELSLNKCFIDDMVLHADKITLHNCAGRLYTTKVDSLVVFGGCITVDERISLEVDELHLNRCLFVGNSISCGGHDFVRPSSILIPGTSLVVLYDNTHCLLGGNTAIQFRDLGDVRNEFWWREPTEETKEICEEWQKVECLLSENLDFIDRRCSCER